MSDEGALRLTDIPRPWPLIHGHYIVSWLSSREIYNFEVSQAHIQICDAFIYQPQNLSDTYYCLLRLLHRPSLDPHVNLHPLPKITKAMSNGAPCASEGMEMSGGHHSTVSDHGDAGMVIGWDGEDDPECPYNWPRKRILANTGMLTILTFLIPLTSCE